MYELANGSLKNDGEKERTFYFDNEYDRILGNSLPYFVLDCLSSSKAVKKQKSRKSKDNKKKKNKKCYLKYFFILKNDKREIKIVKCL